MASRTSSTLIDPFSPGSITKTSGKVPPAMRVHAEHRPHESRGDGGPGAAPLFRARGVGLALDIADAIDRRAGRNRGDGGPGRAYRRWRQRADDAPVGGGGGRFFGTEHAGDARLQADRRMSIAE